MKTLLGEDSLVFDPPELGCVLCLSGLPGGGSKIYDKSPYCNIGTIIGATWVRLPSGLWCLSFDGVDDYFRKQNASGLPTGATDPWTLMGWFWVPSYQADTFQFGFGKVATGQCRNFYMWQNVIYFQGYGADWNSSTSWDTETWQHLAFKTDGTTIYLFKNGNQVNSDPLPSLSDITEFNIWGGGYTGFNCELYLALPSIWNRDLSALEIQNHFNRERHLFGVW